MKKKISIKNLYLIGIICIGLTILAVGSTYAMFTAEAKINNPISLASNLTYTSDIIETIDVTVEPVSTKYITLNVTNSTSDTLNYVSWYSSNSSDLEAGRNTDTDITAGTISASSSKSIGVYLRNNSGKTITVQVGVSSSKDSVILASNMKIISNDELPSVNLSRYVTSMYTNASKTVVTNNSINYNYAKDSSLMNDRLGGTTTSLDAGNIRYYGANPNNYIYYNCSDYDNQSADTCELWRIIGVFDGKVKIIRNESIGNYSYDTSASNINDGHGINEWSQADLMKLLNNGYESNTDLNNSGTSITVNNSLYWNSKSGTCYNASSNATTSCDFTNIGLKNDITKNMFITSNYNLGGWNTTSIYSDEAYIYERGTNVAIPGTTCGGTLCNDTVTRTTLWTGKMALAYASDYGYASNLSQCSQTLWDSYDSTCTTGSNWLYNEDFRILLTPLSSYGHGIWTVNTNGAVSYGGNTNTARGIYPSAYLNPNISIDIGTGEKNNPYQIHNSSEFKGKYFNGINNYHSVGFSNQDLGKSLTAGIRFNADILKSSEVDLLNNFELAGFGIILINTNTIQFAVYSTSSSSYIGLNSTTTIEAGKWYNVIATYDGSNLKLYVNGVLEGTLSFNENLKITSAPIMLGANPNSSGNPTGEYFNGIISDAFLTSEVLSESTISNNFTDGFNYTANGNTYFSLDFK